MSSTASSTGTTTLARGRSSPPAAGRARRPTVPGSSRTTGLPVANAPRPAPDAVPAPVDVHPPGGGACVSEVSMALIPVDRMIDSFLDRDLGNEAQPLACAADRIDTVLGERPHARTGERRIDPQRAADELQDRAAHHGERIGIAGWPGASTPAP